MVNVIYVFDFESVVFNMTAGIVVHNKKVNFGTAEKHVLRGNNHFDNL